MPTNPVAVIVPEDQMPDEVLRISSINPGFEHPMPISIPPPNLDASISLPPSPVDLDAKEDLFDAVHLDQILHKDLRFVRIIGEGTFKKIWSGELRTLGRWVAIAEFKPSDGKEKNEYEKECAIAMQLPAHPNVVKVLGIVIDSESLFIVYEFVKLGSLFRILYEVKMKLSAKIKWTIITGIARGLSFLHANKIAHRDMKSDNILISADFTARITDFGMSKKRAGADDSDETMATTMCGTGLWLPPEIMKNEAYNTFTADIYSCALVIFEVMSGKLPYAHVRNEAELVHYVTIRNKRPMFSAGGDPVESDERLQSILTQMWHSDPKARHRFPELLEMICGACPFKECLRDTDISP